MECSTILSRVIASCFAIVGFVAALVIGFAADLSADAILWRAMVVMVICWPVGRLLGALAQHAVEENINEYKRSHPIPRDAASVGAAAGGEVGVDIEDDAQPPARTSLETEAGRAASRSR